MTKYIDVAVFLHQDQNWHTICMRYCHQALLKSKNYLVISYRVYRQEQHILTDNLIRHIFIFVLGARGEWAIKCN